MEYDIINEILTSSVAYLFQSSLSHKNPHLTSNISADPENNPQRTKIQLSQSSSLASGDSQTNNLSLKFSERNISPELQKLEQKVEIHQNFETKSSINKINENNTSQKITQINTGNEPTQNKESFQSTKIRERLEPPQESQNFIKENSAKTNSTTPLTSEQWILKVGPQKLNEALERLNLTINTINKVNLASLSSKQIEMEKKNVKNELKRYDASFTELFKRMPNRAEKEPMRPLYNYYKKLKQCLTNEPGEEKTVISSKQHSLGNVSVESEKNSMNSIPEAGFRERENRNIQTSNSLGKRIESSFEENLNRDKIFGKGAYQDSSLKQEPFLKIEKKVSKDEARKKLEILDAVKTSMREKLHSYQMEFTKNNNRKIKYHKDIAPVEEEYKRYKEVKEEMAMLEEILKS